MCLPCACDTGWRSSERQKVRNAFCEFPFHAKFCLGLSIWITLLWTPFDTASSRELPSLTTSSASGGYTWNSGRSNTFLLICPPAFFVLSGKGLCQSCICMCTVHLAKQSGCSTITLAWVVPMANQPNMTGPLLSLQLFKRRR